MSSARLEQAPEVRFTSGGSVLDPRRQWAFLVGEWRLMVRPATMLGDGLAGIAVALVALPLSLAIANASGVKPEVGLVTAVVGGIVVALTGGCRLQVTGPAAAMTFLVFEIVTKYGLNGLLVATMIAAALQVLAGTLRIGRFMQLMPRPVIAGFLSGIGLTILSTQLPVILQLEVRHDEEGGALALLWQTVRQLDRAEPTSLAVGGVAMAIMWLAPWVSRRLPAPLLAVLGATLLPPLLGWDKVALLGPLPRAFPTPSLPDVPWHEWNELVMAALAIFVLASIESLLSASVVDAMAKDHRGDNDQELIGQGLGNLASALFGGIPVTGVIARSATNVQSGAKTRLSAVIHAFLLLAMMFVLAPWVARIPLAALAGVLLVVALRMLEIHLLRALWRGHRPEAIVFVATTGAIVMTDMIVGVPVGMAAAFFYVVYEMSQLIVRPVTLSGREPVGPEEGPIACPGVMVIEVEGPLFFGSGFHLRNLVRESPSAVHCIVLDLGSVPFLDLTGAEVLEETIRTLRGRGSRVILARPPEAIVRRLQGLTHTGDLPFLGECPVYPELRDAMLHAASELTVEKLCPACRTEGRCHALVKALGDVETRERTPVPSVRAVVSTGEEDNGWVAKAKEGATGDIPTATPGSLRPGPATSWNSRRGLPTIHSSAFVDPRATLIGEVTVGEHVYIGPGVSVRADEGTPFHIGADSNLQDGVIIHALKGKVVLVKGRPYAVYVGKNVSLTHGALVHGPCYIGDDCFLGFKSMVHDSVVGEGCVVGLGAVVLGVTLPPGRFVDHNTVVDTKEKADALPPISADWVNFRKDVVEVNQELAAKHREEMPMFTPTAGEAVPTSPKA